MRQSFNLFVASLIGVLVLTAVAPGDTASAAKRAPRKSAKTSKPPKAAPNDTAPVGVFGGGLGILAGNENFKDKPALFDLKTRSVTSSIKIGAESSVFGFSASADGTLTYISSPLFKSEYSIRILRSDVGVVKQFPVALGTGKVKSAAAISADGKRIAFGATAPLVGKPGRYWVVYVSDSDGGNGRFIETTREVRDELTERMNPVWLNDDRLLVHSDLGIYTSTDASASDLALTNPTVFAAPNRTFLDRRNQRLIFDQSVGAPNSRVWSYDIASGQSRQLTDGNFEQYAAAVSPDGKWLLYLDNQSTLLNGVPTGNREYSVSVIPLTDRTTDVTGRSFHLKNPAGRSIGFDSGLVAWV
jgi:WD40-like Beta Propeller Repeat